jgi:hypothetical protein
MKRVTTYESGGDSDDEFIEYVFDFCEIGFNNFRTQTDISCFRSIIY